ncbi:MAG: extracellular solute-binding protein [Crenarchaeota archaeon]|nr:extracellular solute-binding protein [Thermoproteota archaeon]
MDGDKISRRKAISTASKVTIGVVAAGAIAGAAGYLAGLNAAQPARTETITRTETVGGATVRETVTRTVTTGPQPVTGPPLQFVHWHYRDDIVTSYVKKFMEYYGEKVDEVLLANENYGPLMEAKFQAGDVIDMHYANFFMVSRWISLGWDRDVEAFREIDQIKAEMYPSIVEAYSTAEGKLAGLPYFWSARSAPVVNDDILEKAGMGGERPGTWDELWEMSRRIKATGAATYPVMPHWFNAFYGIVWDFEAELGNAYNDPDLTKTFIAKDFSPVFDVNTEVAELLKTWQDVTKEGLVDPAVFGQAGDSDHVSAIVTGKYAFTPTALYYFKVQNDPSQSRIPLGKANLVPVTKQGWGVIDTGLYCWPKKVTDEERSQRLIKFFGWRTPEGERLTATSWAITDALGSGYMDTLRLAKVKNAFREWLGDRAEVTLKIFDDIALTMSRPWVYKSPMYLEWANFAFPVLSAIASGTQSVTDGVKTLRTKLDELYKKYHAK